MKYNSTHSISKDFFMIKLLKKFVNPPSPPPFSLTIFVIHYFKRFPQVNKDVGITCTIRKISLKSLCQTVIALAQNLRET